MARRPKAPEAEELRLLRAENKRLHAVVQKLLVAQAATNDAVEHAMNVVERLQARVQQLEREQSCPPTNAPSS